MKKKSLEKLSKEIDRSLVFGMGGGGDVVGCIPTAKYLEILGVDVVLGGLSWERISVDPLPGPRRIEEIENCERIGKYAALVNEETKTNYGVRFSESILCEFLDNEIVLIDINHGVKGTVKAIEDLLNYFNCELVVGIDVGGDVLATGKENVKSPLADAISLSALCKFEKSVAGAFGLGCDGELRIEESLRNISKIAMNNGLLGARGLTIEDAQFLEVVVEKIPTEASRLPLLAFKGALGKQKIRFNERIAEISPVSTITFYMDPRKVYEINPFAKAVNASNSLEEANKRVNKLGFKTELDYEAEYSREV
ncbi:MAG: DUF1152 domain-containing protein [Candidatus Hydrothermarchaeota archaeon]